MARQDRYQRPGRRSGHPVEPFFDLRIPAHAYLLGLLQTDGHHSAGDRNRGRISLELAERDASLLDDLVELVPWYSSVRRRERTTNFKASYATATWTLSSWDARTELAGLGLPPGRKSESIAPPTGPMSERDYVRGLIDGDGSLGFTGTGRPFVSFVTASEVMARYLEDFAQRTTGVRRRTNANQRDDVYNPMYQTSAASTLAAELYQPGDLALPRKARAAALVARWKRPDGMRCPYQARRWTAEEDALVRTARSVGDLAELLGRTPRSISMRRWRLKQVD